MYAIISKQKERKINDAMALAVVLMRQLGVDFNSESF